MTDGIKDKNLFVICHSYNYFQKDPFDLIAPHVASIYVSVRTNPFAEIGKHLPILRNEIFSSVDKIDRTNTPENTHVYSTPIWYLPTDRGYKNLGQKQYNRVTSLIQKKEIIYDLIHCHFVWSAGYAGARLKEEFGGPFVVTAHGYDIYSLPFMDDEWREKIEYVLNTADHIITVSQSNLACINRLNVSTPVSVIPNGFRSDIFYPRDAVSCRTLLNLPHDRKIVLTVGYFDPIKGHTYLIEAAREIISKRKDVLFVIVGLGKLQTTLEDQIRSLGLEDHFLFAGGKPHSEIPLWMNASDIFVLPSLNEGNPTVMFEALGCGLPFVGTRVGGVPEIITSETCGLLVEPADPKGLAEKILLALEKEWDREAILAYADQFAWESIAERIIGVYNQVLE
ncbi:glycosyl transferase group 1 [Methanosphaerula palustris E1-9c]|uniref:Glycosyl transferase group 1 n=1 Tax=Methanosphaerula palustris (strain ATCC BAA-1556 / DSM 19958 / E1-9c) TaxID=521011 RepID=B8GGE6_METPE|nr:glycosyl transferase group 1 [Methanosphaerula palustris E1-9c]